MNIKRILSRVIDIFVVLAAFLLTNSTAFSAIVQFPDLANPSGYAWTVVAACIIIIVALIIQLKFLSLWNDYQKSWKKQLPLVVFIVFCLSSSVWSVYFVASLYELSLMVFSSSGYN